MIRRIFVANQFKKYIPKQYYSTCHNAYKVINKKIEKYNQCITHDSLSTFRLATLPQTFTMRFEKCSYLELSKTERESIDIDENIKHNIRQIKLLSQDLEDYRTDLKNIIDRKYKGPYIPGYRLMVFGFLCKSKKYNLRTLYEAEMNFANFDFDFKLFDEYYNLEIVNDLKKGYGMEDQTEYAKHFDKILVRNLLDNVDNLIKECQQLINNLGELHIIK